VARGTEVALFLIVRAIEKKSSLQIWFVPDRLEQGFAPVPVSELLFAKPLKREQNKCNKVGSFDNFSTLNKIIEVEI